MSYTLSAFKVGEHPVPFRQTQETVKGLASLIALMPQMLLYDRLGLNLVSKARIIGLVVFLLGASWFGNLMFAFSLFGGLRFASANDNSLRTFAFFVMLPLGLWQNRQRLREEKRGDAHINTWWPGDCRLAFLPISEKLLRLCVNPLTPFITGAFLRYRLGAGILGLWLMISALALFIVEWSVWRQSLEHGRDVLDRMDEAARDAEMLRPAKRQETNQNGIGTGSDADLAAEIERRRKQATNDTQGGLTQ
jgi:hypothetical protein